MTGGLPIGREEGSWTSCKSKDSPKQWRTVPSQMPKLFHWEHSNPLSAFGSACWAQSNINATTPSSWKLFSALRCLSGHFSGCSLPTQFIPNTAPVRLARGKGQWLPKMLRDEQHPGNVFHGFDLNEQLPWSSLRAENAEKGTPVRLSGKRQY